MARESHFSMGLHQRLHPYIGRRDYDGLVGVLSTLSNSQFRTAGYMIGERYATEIDNGDFWALFARLHLWDAKAFLVTMLKSLCQRISSHRSDIRDEGFASLCANMNEIDRQKTLRLLLPVMPDHLLVVALFKAVGFDDRRTWLPFLINAVTLPCYYVLFNSLRFVEDDRAYLVRLAVYLIRKGDSLSFSMASLIREYFGLDEVKGTFSLRLRPYQLSHIETSYESFLDIMRM